MLLKEVVALELENRKMESYNWLFNFVQKKTDVSKALYCGRCNGSYYEAVIILSSVISGIASEIWIGHRIDRKRFGELLVKYTKSNLQTKKISIPLLINHLKKSKNDADLNASKLLKNQFDNFQMTRVLIGDEIDQIEEDILTICPTIPLQILRKFSYANVFYQQVRCGFVHEYMPNNMASSHPQTSRETFISYVNVTKQPNRRIYFHFDWLLEVILSIKENVLPILDDLPLQVPQIWWLDEKFI